jgi:hypothetical protein
MVGAEEWVTGSVRRQTPIPGQIAKERMRVCGGGCTADGGSVVGMDYGR